MSDFVQVELDDGAWLRLESVEPAETGPLKASRLDDAVRALPGNLRGTLGTITQASREVLTELRGVGPDEIKVEFGVTLKAGVGAVVTRGEAGCHLKITLGWTGGSAPASP